MASLTRIDLRMIAHQWELDTLGDIYVREIINYLRQTIEGIKIYIYFHPFKLNKLKEDKTVKYIFLQGYKN